MGNIIKSFNEFVKIQENQTAEPVVKPKTTPKIAPSRPSPIPTIKPSVNPAPKASADDVIKKFLKSADKETIKALKNRLSTKK